MEFLWQDKSVVFRDDPSLDPNSVSLHQLQAMAHHAIVAEIFSINVCTIETLQVVSAPLEFPVGNPSPVSEILQCFQAVFQAPTGLPPHRIVDHCIHLVEGTKPVNVRPYCYPHFQKAKMECLIREMLDQGIIIPSHGPFSSPVLLVRKKDGSWRFYVD